MHYASRPTPAICASLFGVALLSCATSQAPARSPDEHAASTKAPEPVKRLLPQPIERVLPWLNDRFGIYTVADLKRAIPEELSRTNRSEGWLLSWLKDFPSMEQVWGHLLLEDPYDLEAAVNLANTQLRLGDLDGALVTLRHTPAEKLKLRDQRASRLLQPSGIKSLECEVLRLQGKAAQARRACESAIKMGSKLAAPFLLAELLFLASDDSAALQYVAVRIEAEPDFGPAYFLQGLIYSELHRPEDARKAWVAALAKSRGYTPARMALDGKKMSRAAWLNVVDQFFWAEIAEELALCGHYYMDLDIPERGETCFRAADRVLVGPATAQRILHKAETDPAGALRDADAIMKTVSHQDIEGAVARIYLAQQRAGEALKWAEEALYRDSQNPKFNQLADDVCSALNDRNCIVHYRAAHPR